MKKPIGIALAMLFVMAGSAFAATTALDTVGTAYSVTDGAILLGFVGGGASLSAHGVWKQTEPGARASLDAISDSKASGSLQYTLHGKGSCKITVTTETLNYRPNSLWVACYSFSAGGSDNATLGQSVAVWPGSTPIINSTQVDGVQDFITGISGADTWTGTGANEGAMVQYGLFANPGVSSVVVTYTIVEE